MTLKEKYKQEIGRSPFVFDKKGRIRENFSYTDSYVSWLENQINNNKQITDDFIIGFVNWLTNENSKYAIMYGNQEKRFADFENEYTIEELLKIYKKL